MALVGSDGTPIISIDDKFRSVYQALLINEEKIHQLAYFCNSLADRIEKLEKSNNNEETV